MKIKISQNPKAEILVTNTFLQLLMSMSRAHYDGFCRATSKAGGLLFSWTDMMSANQEMYFQITRRDADLLSKVTEFGSWLPEVEQVEIGKFRRTLKCIIDILDDAKKADVVEMDL